MGLPQAGSYKDNVTEESGGGSAIPSAGEYVALLTQTGGPGVPTINEIVNTTGYTPVLTRLGDGWYRLTFSGVNLAGKMLINFPNQNRNNSTAAPASFGYSEEYNFLSDETRVNLFTTRDISGDHVGQDGLMENAMLQITILE